MPSSKTDQTTHAETARPKRPRLRRPIGFAVGALVVVAVALVLLRPRIAEVFAIRRDASLARALVSEGRYNDARSPLVRWLKARPESPEALALLARSMLGVGLVDQAIPVRRRAEAVGYSFAPVEREWALNLVKAGRASLAEPTLKALVAEGSPPDPAVDEALARYYMGTSQDREALKVLARWRVDDPAAALPYLWDAVLGQRADKGPEVLINDYEQALKRDPSLDEARVGLAIQLLDQHQTAEARDLLVAYLGRKPDDAAARASLGKALAELGDEPGAIRELDRAMALDPRNIEAPMTRAKLELRSGRLQSALDYVDRAIAIDPGESDPRFTRSMILGRLGRTAEALAERKVTDRLRADDLEIRALRRALAHAPRDVGLRLKIAQWLLDHDHPDEAKSWAEQVAKDVPASPQANRLLALYHTRKGNPGLARYYALKAGDDSLPAQK
ncbi:tetratricopeptide repeat protein [Isosphaeraceae bacterium EP7]